MKFPGHRKLSPGLTHVTLLGHKSDATTALHDDMIRMILNKNQQSTGRFIAERWKFKKYQTVREGMTVSFFALVGVAFDNKRMIRQNSHAMQTKLTLRLDSKDVSRARRQTKKRSPSFSKVVADKSKGAAVVKRSSTHGDLTPITRELAGSLVGSKLDEKDYRLYLENKYR